MDTQPKLNQSSWRQCSKKNKRAITIKQQRLVINPKQIWLE